MGRKVSGLTEIQTCGKYSEFLLIISLRKNMMVVKTGSVWKHVDAVGNHWYSDV